MTASTLVIHPGALGDTVLAWPWLRAAGPVTFAASASRARLAARWLTDVTPVDGDAPAWSALFADTGPIAEPVRDALARASRIVTAIEHDVWTRRVRQCASDTPVLLFPMRPGPGTHEAMGDLQRRALAGQGLPVESIQPPLRRHPDGPVVVHPGSGGRDKCWPPERFEVLMEHCLAIGRPAQLIWGEAERERLPAAFRARWHERFETIEPDDPVALSECIARAACFVGNDSGPTHLAAQLGVPTVALFGPTDPRVWAPTGPAVCVIAPPGPQPMTWLPLEAVIEAVSRF